MFDRFPNEALRAMALARKAVASWRHGVIDLEHILLGVLGDADAVAVAVLSRLGIDRAQLQASCESTMVPGDVVEVKGMLRQIPFTPGAKTVLETAMREADLRGDRHIGTEHILLGLLQAPADRLPTLLAALGTSLEAVRAAVAAVVDE